MQPTSEPLRCPSCGNRLVEVERSTILIDACQGCRGVWLDRGELDKIIERAGPETGYRDPDPEYIDRREPYGKPYYKRRKSFFGDLFDFD